MNKSLLIGLVAGAGVATAIGAVASYSRSPDSAQPVAAALPASTGAIDRAAEPVVEPAVEPAADATVAPKDEAPAAAPAPRVVAKPAPSPGYARVVEVQPVTKTVKQPREVCHDEQVVKQAPVQDEHKVAGTLVGAVLGGVIGHQIGDGKGRKIATVAGAAAGGYAGNRVQNRMQEKDTVTETVKKCETVYDAHEQQMGYDVTYSFEGRTQTVRMKHDPGERLPVKNGKVVTG